MPTDRRELRWVLVVVFALAALALPSPARATGEVPGGTFASPVALPTSVPGSFVATNDGVLSPGVGSYSAQPFWYNTTWYSYTPAATGPVSIRVTSISPVDWDNTLEVWTAGEVFVAESDDDYDYDSLLTPMLDAGTTYLIGLGGYDFAGAGSATITLGTEVPDAPTGLTATGGNGSATLSWGAAVDRGSPISDYTVECQQDGGSWTTCATLNGTPPATGTTLTGLVNGSSYRFRVTATNSIGVSAASAVVPAPGVDGLFPGVASTTTATAQATAVRFADVPVTATVVSGGSPVSGGTVTVSDGGTVLGTGAVTGGSASVVVHPVPGSRTLTVAFGGTAGIADSSTTVPVTVTRAPQTVTLASLSPAAAGTSQPVLASSSAGLPVTLAATGPCTVSGTQVSADAAGSCTVTASAAGDGDRLAATAVSRSFDVVAPLDLGLRVETPLGGPAAGATVVARAAGLQPGSAVTLELHSTPRQLASGVAAADGTVTIPTALPNDIEAGDHELVLLGVAPDGSSVRSVLALGVSGTGRLVRIGDDRQPTAPPALPAPPAAAALATTGSPVDLLGGAVAVLLLLGGGLQLIGRPRRRTAA